MLQGGSEKPASTGEAPGGGLALGREAAGAPWAVPIRALPMIALAAALAGLLVLPLVGPTHYALLMLSFFAHSIVLLGLNLLFGYTGLLSFGHGLFLALGAYSAAYLTSKLGIRHMEVILIVAALVSVLVAVPVGLLCVRYVKIYFGMLTLAFGMLFWSFLVKFYNLTGADQGMRVLTPSLLGQAPAPGEQLGFLVGPYYYYCFVLLLLMGFVMWRIVHSPFGLCLRTVRENPVKAEYLGIAVTRYRWYSFLVSAVYAGVGGALLAPVSGLADPTLTYWTQSGLLVFMLLLGGFRNFFGPLLGAFAFIFLQDRVMAHTEYWRLVFGAILALVVIVAPGGLMGLLQSWWRRGMG